MAVPWGGFWGLQRECSASKWLPLGLTPSPSWHLTLAPVGFSEMTMGDSTCSAVVGLLQG